MTHFRLNRCRGVTLARCGVQGPYGRLPAAAPNAPAAPQTGTVPQEETIEAMKRFKELLDMGILTQEEFDAKKKQLLGL